MWNRRPHTQPPPPPPPCSPMSKWRILLNFREFTGQGSASWVGARGEFEMTGLGAGVMTESKKVRWIRRTVRGCGLWRLSFSFYDVKKIRSYTIRWDGNHRPPDILLEKVAYGGCSFQPPKTFEFLLLFHQYHRPQANPCQGNFLSCIVFAWFNDIDTVTLNKWPLLSGL